MMVNHSEFRTDTRVIRKGTGSSLRELKADTCIVGAGIAGVSAALEAARLGHHVALVDSLPALGGQAVNSIIGAFCGLFANGRDGYQLTHGIATTFSVIWAPRGRCIIAKTDFGQQLCMMR